MKAFYALFGRFTADRERQRQIAEAKFFALSLMAKAEEHRAEAVCLEAKAAMYEARVARLTDQPAPFN